MGPFQRDYPALIPGPQAGIQVSVDVYPYTYWQSTLEVLFPKRDFDNRTSAEFALRELSSPEGMFISSYSLNPAYVGKTIAQIALEKKQDPAITYMQLIRDARQANASESVIGKSLNIFSTYNYSQPRCKLEKSQRINYP